VTVVVALLGLILLIVIHELGHMLTAKALGVRVTEFGIGFGPALFKKKIGETVYSFRVVLLGGFARMAGMEGAAGVEETRDEHGPDSYNSKPPWRRALIIFAGPAVNIVAAALIFSGLYMTVGIPTEVEPTVSAVAQDSLADEVGLREGDRLVAVDGEPVRGWEGFTEYIDRREPGEEISLTVERGGETIMLSGELGSAPNDPDQAQVGVVPEVSERSHSPLLALWEGAQRTVQLTGALVSGIFQVVTGQLDFFQNVSGPVGIVGAGSQSVEQGFFVPLLALISLTLGIMNLLPILPLDGGHLLFIAAEKIRGRPVSPETMGKVAALGVALVVMLVLFATYADVSKIISGQPFIPE
jgi:regulator of sigma E protease